MANNFDNTAAGTGQRRLQALLSKEPFQGLKSILDGTITATEKSAIDPNELLQQLKRETAIECCPI